MKRFAVIGGAVVLLGAILALLAPLWTMTAGMGMSGHGYMAVFLMILFCFGLAGGLMFLVFYSARRGHDDAVHSGSADRPSERAGFDDQGARKAAGLHTSPPERP